MKLLSGPPKANAKPTAHQHNAAIEKFVRIFATTVPAFFCLEKPISRNANPACMNITSDAATITQTELIPTVSDSLPSIASCRSSVAATPVDGKEEKHPPARPAAPGAATSTFAPSASLLVRRPRGPPVAVFAFIRAHVGRGGASLYPRVETFRAELVRVVRARPPPELRTLWDRGDT